VEAADGMSADGFISVRGWRRFQHYRDRSPRWIKAYPELLTDDAYLALSGHRRSILHGLWLEYASSHCRLRFDTASLSRRLSLRVTTSDIEALTHAGFLAIVASAELADGYQDASAPLAKRSALIREEPLRGSSSEAASAAGPKEPARRAAQDGENDAASSRPRPDKPARAEAALAFIRNGAAGGIAEGHLSEVLADEYNLAPLEVEEVLEAAGRARASAAYDVELAGPPNDDTLRGLGDFDAGDEPEPAEEDWPF
jgi:hypothetical protein